MTQIISLSKKADVMTLNITFLKLPFGINIKESEIFSF
jgi:hypothetical protein